MANLNVMKNSIYALAVVSVGIVTSIAWAYTYEKVNGKTAQVYTAEEVSEKVASLNAEIKSYDEQIAYFQERVDHFTGRIQEATGAKADLEAELVEITGE